MKRVIVLPFLSGILLSVLGLSGVYAQCSIDVAAVLQGSNQQTLVCGDSAQLIVVNGFGVGSVVFEENFNSGAPTGWQSTSQATYTNPCSPNGVDGTPHLWMGSAASVPRIMTTQSFNLSTAVAGATICFDLLFATQGNAAPCEGPDEPNEGVFLQYSTNNGATWTEIHYFNPNGGNDPQLTNWNNWCFSLPAAAITANTQIRWIQTSDSGSDYDHWGIDNVQIFFNDPNYTISWLHDGYTYPFASTGGPNPNAVFPTETTTYTAQITNGVNTCTASVTVNVVLPTASVSVQQDTSICAGECVTLTGDARIIKRPAKTPTYSNNNVTPVANAFGSTTTSTISISDLNMEQVLPNSITSVCINFLNFFGTGLTPTFPPQFVQYNIGNLTLRMYCPDGSFIVLVPAGQTSSSSPLGGYTNTCFIPAGGGNISSSASPYTGNFAPNQPFNNLVGCTANGDWVLELQTNSPFGFGSGFFGGWRITFDDPEISYQGDFAWSPTTNMTGSNTLTPEVCPTSQTTYTLSVTDTAGCIAPVTASATISIDPDCCPITFDAVVDQPSCAVNNGSISVSILNGSGNYQFTWTGSATGNTNTLSNLGAGTYNLSVFDVTLDCIRDTSFTLILPNAPTIDNISSTPETCAGDNDGTVTASASGGTGALTYTWTPGNLTGATQTGLAPNTYTVTVEDQNGCQVTQQVVVAAGANCCNLSVTANISSSTCANADGSIALTVSNGSGNYSFSWVGGASTLQNVAAGTYSVTITDLDVPNCSIDTSFNVSDLNAPVLTISNVVNPTCGASDGSLTAGVSGGTAPYTVTVDTGGTPIVTPLSLPISAPVTGLSAGTVTITIQDANNCTTVQTVTLAEPANCCEITVAANITNSTCGNNTGSIELTVSNGTGNYSFSWASGTNTLSNLGTGTYSVTITDLDAPVACSIDTSFSVNDADGPVINSISASPETCAGLNNGSVSATASGGTGTLTYTWSPGNLTGANQSNLAPATYTLTVSDVNGCLASQSVTVGAGSSPQISVSNVVNPTCAGNDGSLVGGISGGTAPYTVTVDTGGTPQVIPLPFPINAPVSNLPAGSVTITVQDANGCSASQTITLTAPTDCCDLEILEVNTIDESCADFNDGVAEVVFSGGTSPLSFNWNGIQNSESLIADLTPGNYSLTITDANGCEASSNFSIEEGLLVSISLGNDTTIRLGESVELQAEVSGLGTIIWTPDTFLSCSDCLNPVASPTSDIVYTATYIDGQGCEQSDIVRITVLPDQPYCLFPDAFTPNGDNINDLFRGICDGAVFIDLKIYNRWGELVYAEVASNGRLRGWDGTYKARNAPMEVYVYYVYVEYNDGRNESRVNNVTLIR